MLIHPGIKRQEKVTVLFNFVERRKSYFYRPIFIAGDTFIRIWVIMSLRMFGVKNTETVCNVILSTLPLEVS